MWTEGMTFRDTPFQRTWLLKIWPFSPLLRTSVEGVVEPKDVSCRQRRSRERESPRNIDGHTSPWGHLSTYICHLYPLSSWSRFECPTRGWVCFFLCLISPTSRRDALSFVRSVRETPTWGSVGGVCRPLWERLRGSTLKNVLGTVETEIPQ